uniref:Uncharacterized protein n=1 Tax=Lactuca sativa TaxID=4236 RepID=A0A9R1XQM6_LACSA|nr:hypothetical protein LSAT_V11C200054010 [Lactuca sativa]
MIVSQGRFGHLLKLEERSPWTSLDEVDENQLGKPNEFRLSPCIRKGMDYLIKSSQVPINLEEFQGSDGASISIYIIDSRCLGVLSNGLHLLPDHCFHHRPYLHLHQPRILDLSSLIITWDQKVKNMTMEIHSGIEMMIFEPSRYEMKKKSNMVFPHITIIKLPRKITKRSDLETNKTKAQLELASSVILWRLRMTTIKTTMDRQPNTTNKPEYTNAAKIQNSALGYKIWGIKGPFIRYGLLMISLNVFVALGLGYLFTSQVKDDQEWEILETKKAFSRTRPIEAYKPKNLSIEEEQNNLKNFWKNIEKGYVHVKTVFIVRT